MWGYVGRPKPEVVAGITLNNLNTTDRRLARFRRFETADSPVDLKNIQQMLHAASVAGLQHPDQTFAKLVNLGS